MTLISNLTPVGPILGGATLASASTITTTAEFHQVSGTTTIANIAVPGRGTGTFVQLLFQAALIVQHNSGGTGNIRIANGSDKYVRANEVITFVYDGTVWREAREDALVVSSAPPSSPVLYQRWIYQVNSTRFWEFMYRNDLDATYPWHFLGGAPMHVAAGPTSTGSGTDVDVGPDLTVPRNGVFRGEWKVTRSVGTSNNATQAITTCMANGISQGVIKGDYDADLGGGAISAELTLASGNTLTFYLHSSFSGNGVGLDERSIDLHPIKIA